MNNKILVADKFTNTRITDKSIIIMEVEIFSCTGGKIKITYRSNSRNMIQVKGVKIRK